MKKIILTLVACVALTFGAQAQLQKIATVDNRKVLENYYLAWQEDVAYQQEDQRLTQEAAEARKLKVAADEKLAELVKKSRDKSFMEGLSPEALDQFRQEGNKALDESSKLQTAMESLRENAVRNLTARKKRSHQELMKKINAIVAQCAQKEGYSLVLNTSIDFSNPYRAVLFDAGKSDITEEVIKILNADMPEGTTKPQTLVLFN